MPQIELTHQEIDDLIACIDDAETLSNAPATARSLRQQLGDVAKESVQRGDRAYHVRLTGEEVFELLQCIGEADIEYGETPLSIALHRKLSGLAESAKKIAGENPPREATDQANLSVQEQATAMTPVIRSALKRKAGAAGWIVIFTFVLRWLPTIVQLVIEALAVVGKTDGLTVPHAIDPDLDAAFASEQAGTLEPWEGGRS